MAERQEKVCGSLFEAEERVVAEAEAFLACPQAMDPGSAARYTALAAHYTKLLRQAKRLVRLSDRSQRELNTLNQRLKESEEKYRHIFENMAEGLFHAGPDGRLLETNPAMAAILGYAAPAELVDGLALRQVPPPIDRADWRILYENLCRQGGVEGFETRMRKRDGSFIEASISARVRRDGQGNLLAIEGLVLDITQRRRMEERLRHLASTDSLTGLPNRRQFMALGTREFARAQRHHLELTALMIDVDHFKKVNDTHGHEVGDRVLKAFGRGMQAVLRGHDIIGRIGGEEFAALLIQTPLPEAVLVARRLKRSLAELAVKTNDGIDLTCTVSMGASQLRPDLPCLDALLAEADRALYGAKRAGRNCVMSISPGDGALCAHSPPEDAGSVKNGSSSANSG